MRLKFKHQKFQTDAAKAVVDVFAGQPFLTPSFNSKSVYVVDFDTDIFSEPTMQASSESIRKF